MVAFMRTSFFFLLHFSSPLLGQTTSTSDASSCWPLEEQPQPAHSPGPGGDPFSFFSPSLGCFLTGRAIRYFTSLLYPKLFDFCTSPIPPICLFLWIASVPVRLPGSAHHFHIQAHATLLFALPLAWRSGCLLFRLSQSSQTKACLLEPSQPKSPARPSKAKQRYRPGAPLSPSPEPHATARPHPNPSHPRIAGSPFSTLLQSSSPAIPTLPHPSHSLSSAPHWTCTGHASVERSSHSTRLK